MLSIIIISCTGILAYLNSFHCSFHFDDITAFVNNPFIKNIHDLSNIWEYCPCRFITFLSLALNYHFGQLHVFGYHLFNLAVHVSAAFLVYWLALLTFSTPVMKEEKITRHANLISLLAGLVFVSHPVQTEAVTYIWQRAASMAALFYLASLCLYVRSRLLQGINSKYYYIGAVVTAIMAMFTKENVITLPLMIVLYEFSFFKVKQGIKYFLPFLFTLLIIPVTMLLTHMGQARYQEFQNVVGGSGGISPLQYLLTQGRVVVTYIRLVILPFNQNLEYDYPIFKSIFELPLLASFLFLGAIFILTKRLFLKYRLVSFSILWFFLTLLPESSFLPQKDVIFEHRLYLPMVGYSLFLVSSGYYLIGKKNFKAMVIGLAIIIVCYSMLTYQRNKVWMDDRTLWGDVVSKSPRKAIGYNGLGLALYNKGDYEGAISNLKRAIEIDPKFENAYVNRANAYNREGNSSQAIVDFNKAIELNPRDADVYNDRGILYFHLGKNTQALADYNKALDLKPYDAHAYYNRGLVFYDQGNLVQSAADLNNAIEINPDHEEFYNNRGILNSRLGKAAEAMADFNRAIAINPNYAQAYNNRGILNFHQRKVSQAMADYNKAIEIDPNYADAYYNRGLGFYVQGDLIQAIADYSKVIHLDPKYEDAYINRAVAFHALNTKTSR